MKPVKSSSPHRLIDKIAQYTNITTVCQRLDQRGQISSLSTFLQSIKKAEEKKLLTELGDKASAELMNYSEVFKENLKLILSLIGILC